MLYWYTYALNNPLGFTDPSGYYNKPSPHEREQINGEGYYYNYEMAWKMSGMMGSQFSDAQKGPSFEDCNTWVEGPIGGMWIKNSNITYHGTNLQGALLQLDIYAGTAELLFEGSDGIGRDLGYFRGFEGS